MALKSSAKAATKICTLGQTKVGGTMANDVERKAALDLIRQNIALHGFHTYVITGGGNPHYAYTIGLSQSLGAEIVLAGAYLYLLDELPKIIKNVVAELRPPVALDTRKIKLGSW